MDQFESRRPDLRLEDGVVLALRDIATQAGLSWDQVGAAMKREGRLHLETY